MAKGNHRSVDDIDLGVYGDQRGGMFGYWILGTYNPRIITLKEET